MKPRECDVYEGLDETILSVSLSAPRPGIFLDSVKYVLMLGMDTTGVRYNCAMTVYFSGVPVIVIPVQLISFKYPFARIVLFLSFDLSPL